MILWCDVCFFSLSDPQDSPQPPPPRQPPTRQSQPGSRSRSRTRARTRERLDLCIIVCEQHTSGPAVATQDQRAYPQEQEPGQHRSAGLQRKWRPYMIIIIWSFSRCFCPNRRNWQHLQRHYWDSFWLPWILFKWGNFVLLFLQRISKSGKMSEFPQFPKHSTRQHLQCI